MASTGSTAGYNAENFTAQGSTRTEIGGELTMMANSFMRYTASTYTNASTIPVGCAAVVNSSAAVTINLGPAKQGAFTKLFILGASSSGIHTYQCSSDYIINGGSTGVGLTFTVQNPCHIDIYCPSTTVYLISPFNLGSSDLTVTGAT